MSRKHTHTKPKNDKRKLEEIQENKEAVADARAEMLEHNPMLKLHISDIKDRSEEASRNAYIKQPQDAERIARNSTGGNERQQESNSGLLQAQLEKLFVSQCRTMTTFMESWLDAWEAIATATSGSRSFSAAGAKE